MFLSKMAQEVRLRSTPPGTKDVTSRIKAAFQYRRNQVQLNAAIEASTDSSNNDVMLSSRQKWSVTTPSKEHATFEGPLGSFGFYGGIARSERYLRYYVAGNFRILRRRIDGEIPRWASSLLAKVSEYCGGIKYYGASQFTNPSNCPASFQIEEEEGKRRRLTRFRGHEKVLYSMYSAEKEDPKQYNNL
jgi:hypothetical protein